MEGFWYNGKHSDDFHCYFIPDENDRWFASPDFEVYETTDTGKDGGYFYGTKAKVRAFTLKCFYEDATIQQREALRRWLDRDTSGQLIFDRRPFVHYDVRPTKVVQGKRWTSLAPGTNEELYNGTLMITFSAYQPYGLLNAKDYTDFDTGGAELYCGILPHDMMPAAPTVGTPSSFLIYNCGTRKCCPVFRVSGTANAGLVIANYTNKTICQLSGLPSTGYLEIDGNLGSVTWVHGDIRELAFNYHMTGFVALEPYMACENEVVVSYTSGSTTITQPDGEFDERYLDKYIYLDGGWKRIASVNSGDAVLETAPSHSGVTSAKVVTMNQLLVTGENLVLTRLEVDYTPMIV